MGVTNESTAILPKYVAFKGDNGNYLAASWTESHEYLQFNTTDIGNGRVRHEVVPVGDGTVRLKCLHWNKFWRRSPNWIWADTAGFDRSNKDLIFKPIRVNQHSVALRCLGNNWFCKRLTTEGKDDCLNAGTDSLERSTILGVEEPIISRRVHSVEYDMENARIDHFEPLVLCRQTAKNPSSHQSSTMSVSLSYTERKSNSWKNAVSFSTGIKATFDAGIPAIADLKVEISALTTFVREWGETQETQTTITSTHSVTLDPGQEVEVIMKGTHAKCDVNFSYVQEDSDTTGCVFESSKDDGVFKGASYTDIQYETRYY